MSELFCTKIDKFDDHHEVIIPFSGVLLAEKSSGPPVYLSILVKDVKQNVLILDLEEIARFLSEWEQWLQVCRERGGKEAP